VGRCGLDYLAQDVDWWWALMNMIINIQFHKMQGI
jgi:hypothetical protein